MKFCPYCGKLYGELHCPLCQRPNRSGARHCAHCGTSLSRKPLPHPYGTGKLPPGNWIGGRYIILRKVAQGGMAAVYEAKDNANPGMKLALKEMSLQVLRQQSPELRYAVIENFRREFQLLSTLHHPNLVEAYTYFEEAGRHYFVMKFIEGQTLEQVLDNLPAGMLLPSKRVLTWARQLCDVLAYLHTQQPPIIYRDLKPSNIMSVANSEHITLFDFGIARFFKPGKQKGDTLRFGTPGYAAPESVGSMQSGPEADIYALGALLHQLFTNHDPSLNPFIFDPVRSINAQIPEDVARAIHAALEPQPEKRPPSAERMLKALFGPEAQIEWPEARMPSPPPISPPSQRSLAPSPPGVVSLPHRFPAPRVPSVSISTKKLHFGSVRAGSISQPLRFQIYASPNLSGQVVTSTSWLAAEPDHFSSQEREITVTVYAQGLSYGRWLPSTGINLYTRLPGFLQKWVLMHTYSLIPGTRKYTGTVRVVAASTPVQEIGAEVDICPPGWRVKLGWAGVSVLLAFEFGLVLSPILFVLINS